MEMKDQLKALRKENNFKQREVAEILGMDRSTYAYYETGGTIPSIETLIRLKRIYGVSLDFIADHDDYNERCHIAPAQKGSVVAVSQSNPLLNLSNDEKILLACFRLLDEENKQDAIELIKNFTIDSKNKTERKDEPDD